MYDMEESRSKTRAFRFKFDHDSHNEEGRERSKSKRHRSQHRHHHRRHKRPRNDNHVPVTAQAELPPDVAFRESLFDALADEQGADYWASVYGQPIHTYSRSVMDPETGETAMMDDEQYAAYVRRKMWEKSVEGIAAAKEAKRREDRETRQRHIPNAAEYSAEPEDDVQFDFAFEIDASLKRSRRRKDSKQWRQLWRDYNVKWDALDRSATLRHRDSADSLEQVSFENSIAWPVESGQQQDVNYDSVARFVNKAAVASQQDDEDSTVSVLSLLKAERVRWHPDKIQQKYGFMGINDSSMEGVTAVFQIMDSLYTKSRQR